MITLSYNESILSPTSGITMTSANHICNIAKEKYQDLENKLLSMSLYEESIKLISSDITTTTKLGLSNEDFEFLTESHKQISSLKSLIAYLREVINYKEQLLRQYQNLQPDTRSLPEIEILKPISVKPEIPFETYLLTLPIKEYQHYLTLETKATVVGQFVHPNGYLANARKELITKKNNPTKVDLNGQETIITSYTPTVSLKLVEEKFFDLQKEHRHLQAQINKIKSDYKQSEKSRVIRDTEIFNNQNKIYNESIQQYNCEFYNKKQEVLVQIEKLKIVLPDSLKQLYDQLNKDCAV